VYEIIGDHQLALPVALAITPESVRSRWVTDRTDLVVEGFPRSGNTFAAIGIATAQRRPRHIVSHAHIPAQVQRAVRLGVATVVVIRDPFDAVCSMGVADSHHRTSDLLRYWVQYHEQIKRFSDDVVIAPFTQVTDQLGVVVTQVNERFDTDLDPFDDEDEDLHRAVFQAIDHKQRWSTASESIFLRYRGLNRVEPRRSQHDAKS